MMLLSTSENNKQHFDGILKIFAYGIQGPGIWNLEYSSRNGKSH